MSIASQITTMQEHIEDIYDTFAVAGVDTSAAAKNIVNINANLKERLEYYLANGLDVVWNNWNKVSESGTTLSLNNTIQAKMDFVYKGNTSQSILPSGYTQVDYITSDGNSYIDTGKALGDKFKIETKFIHNQQSSNEQPIISTWVNSYAWFNLYIASNNQLRFYAAGNHMTANPTLTIGNINTVSYSRNSNEWVGTLNGEEVTFTTEITSSNLTTFKILARGDVTLGSYVSIYRLKLFENNILTMDLIPCYRNSDNVIGMYDIVNNIFYTNSGTGNFTYGSVAPTPECPIPVNVVTGDNEVKVEGKNLLQKQGYGTPNTDSDYWEGNPTFLTSGDDGWGTFAFDNSSGSSVAYKNMMIENGNVNYKPSTNYTIFVELKDVSKGSATGDMIFLSQGANARDPFSSGEKKITYDEATNKVYRFSATTKADLTNTYAFRTFVVIPAGKNVSFKIRAMIVEGTYTSDTYIPYQSQTYPINLGVKNLIDLINFAPISNNTVVSLIDNGINVNNTSGGYGAKIQLTDLKANTDYYISYNWKNISNGANRVVVFAGTGTSATLASFNNLNGGTFNTEDNTTINIWFYAAVPGIAEVEYTNIQLEEGTVKHSYTPSWFEPIELCKIGDYQDYIAKSTGKNLLDENYYNDSSLYTKSGAYFAFVELPDSFKTKFYVNMSVKGTNQNLVFGFIDTMSGVFSGGIRVLDNGTLNSNVECDFTNAEHVYLGIGNSQTITPATDISKIFDNYNIMVSTTSGEQYEPYGTDWYKYGAISKIVLDGSENWSERAKAGTHSKQFYCYTGIQNFITSTEYCNYFRYNYASYNYSQAGDFAIDASGNNKRIYCGVSDDLTLANFETLIGTNNLIAYYVLSTPTITEITDTTLIEQLEAIKLSYNERTNISQTNTDKPFILDVTALKDLDAEDTTPALTTNRGLLFTQPPVSDNFINDEDDNSILEETINEEEPNIEDDNREEEEPLDFFEKEIINNDEEQEEIPTEPIEIDNGQR